MKIDRRVVFCILMAGLLFLAGILLRDFLLANFVKPIALMLWTCNRLIASIDQTAYWAGLILVLILISLLRLSRQQVIQEVDHTGRENATLDSIRYWRALILLTSNESDRLNFLKNPLQTLLKDIYALRPHSQVSGKTDEDFEQGAMMLPDSIREFLKIDPPSNVHPNLMQRPRQAPIGFVRHWVKQDQTEYYQSIAEVISFMEKQLENEDEQ